jgi:hypothetical protein
LLYLFFLHVAIMKKNKNIFLIKMGANSTKEFNNIFGAGSASADEDGGGPAAGTSARDWGQDGGHDPHQPDTPEAPPTVPTFNKPQFYAPRQSQLQRATYDPQSTSHNVVQRFGVPSHV